jgi:hypothetical protein
MRKWHLEHAVKRISFTSFPYTALFSVLSLFCNRNICGYHVHVGYIIFLTSRQILIKSGRNIVPLETAPPLALLIFCP